MTTSDFVKGSRVALQLCDEAIAKGDENRAMKARIAELEAWVSSVKRMADEALGDAKASGRGPLRLISTSADEILKR